MKKLLSFLALNDLYEGIPPEDVVDRQRFVLFRIFSITGPLVCIGVFTKMQLTIDHAGILPFYILTLAAVILANYFLAPVINNLRLSYTLLLSAACALLHIVSFNCGGIRTAGTFYFSVIILYAFMLLGRKGGLFFTAFALVHVLYLYYLSVYTDFTSYIMFKNDVRLISQDFLTNAILTFFLIASHSNYLQSHKNVIIQGLEKREMELKKSNLQLLERNNLLKEYASSLARSNRELEKFAYVASHDLKAPLRSIGTITGIIEEDAGDSLSPETRENFMLIKRRVLRMEKLINALLEYSKADQDETTYAEVNIDHLIGELLPAINPENKVPVVVEGNLPPVNTDKAKLKLVLSNLITNAIRHNESPQPCITVAASDNESEWQFSVKDNGRGIEKRFHEKIFVIFQTLKARDDEEHMGVGLSISKKIVEDMGGRIWIESEMGRGSDFVFTIPKERRLRPEEAIQQVTG